MNHHFDPLRAVDKSREEQDLLDTARSFIPLLRKRADDIHAQRIIPADIFSAIREAQLLRVLQPRKFGGLEKSPSLLFDIEMALAEGDMSVGWVYGVLSVSAFHLALFDIRAQEDVWRDNKTAVIASAYTPTGNAKKTADGFRITGRWGFASGCDHCDWIFLGAVAEEEGRTPEARVFLIPRSDFKIVDNWRAHGLQGTGSNDIVVEDLYVPDYRSIVVADRARGKTPGLNAPVSPLYQIPFLQLQFRAISTASIGALLYMLDQFIEANKKRVSALGVKAVCDPLAQQVCGDATAAIHEMKIILHQNISDMVAKAYAEVELTLAERKLYRLHATHTPERCCQLAARIFKSSGTGALRTDNPLGRVFADINAARQHAANQFEAHSRKIGLSQMGAADKEDVLL